MAKKLKVAIVCDWLTSMGGAERVVYELHKLYPDAPIYTSQYNDNPKDWYEWNWTSEADIRTTWLQKLPKKLRKFLPVLRAISFSNLDLSAYDLVLSASGAEAKAVKTGPNTLHICYCHSPTQYYWLRYDEYMKHPGFPYGTNWIAKIGLKILITPLRQWDKRAAKRPDILIANSNHTKDMIKKYYRRDSIVIFPPVDTDKFKLKANPPSRHGFVVVGRQTPYKRIDLAVAAFNELKLPLLVIGNGPDHKKLEKLARRNITFLTNVNDDMLVHHLQTSLALIFPTNKEDFGVTAVEALAAGAPVIAYSKGGPLDYIVPNKTGLFFDKQTVASLKKTVEAFNPVKFNPYSITRYAERFDVKVFRQQMKDLIETSLDAKQK